MIHNPYFIGELSTRARDWIVRDRPGFSSRTLFYPSLFAFLSYELYVGQFCHHLEDKAVSFTAQNDVEPPEIKRSDNKKDMVIDFWT